MAYVVRIRPIWDAGVAGEMFGSHIDIEYTEAIPGVLNLAAQAALAMDAVWDWWSTGVQTLGAAKTRWCDEVVLERVTAQRIWPEPPSSVFGDDRAGVPGTFPGDQCPPNSAVTFSWRTDLGARWARGRSYFPAPPEDQVGSQGLMNPGWLSPTLEIVRGLAVELESPARLAAGINSAEHVVISMDSTAVAAGTTTPVTQYLAGIRVDTQRRRLGRESTYLAAP